MKLKYLIYASILSVIVPSGSLVLAAEGQHHHASGAEAIQLELNQDKKWNTDAPLRQGMEAIRSALNSRLGEIHNDALTDAQYRSLAKKINEQVQYMFEHCELEPAADEQLHILLARIMEDTRNMQAEDGGQEGAKQVVRALHAYGEHFNHEDWKGLRH